MSDAPVTPVTPPPAPAPVAALVAAPPAADNSPSAEVTAEASFPVAEGPEAAGADASPEAVSSEPTTAPLPPPAPLPPVRSPDGRFVLTATALTVLGRTFGLREIERAEVQPVRWLLWYLLGGLGLAIVLLLFLNNWLRTLPTMAGLLVTALMLLYGHRGTNRLRLWLLGREAAHFALPGDADLWRRLTGELNRRVARAHDQAAAEAAILLAALEAERNAQAAAAIEAAAEQPPAGPVISDEPA